MTSTLVHGHQIRGSHSICPTIICCALSSWPLMRYVSRAINFLRLKAHLNAYVAARGRRRIQRIAHVPWNENRERNGNTESARNNEITWGVCLHAPADRGATGNTEARRWAGPCSPPRTSSLLFYTTAFLEKSTPSWQLVEKFRCGEKINRARYMRQSVTPKTRALVRV